VNNVPLSSANYALAIAGGRVGPNLGLSGICQISGVLFSTLDFWHCSSNCSPRFDGVRGWVPTNYCEAYDHPYIRNVLNGMTQFWDLLKDNEAASLHIFIRQDYISKLIAGVRCLLEHASCLHRDATLVQQNVGIRRTRKGLLADLSSMVSKAKELQEEAGHPYDEKIIHTMLDELITKAFRVVTRAVRFADAWTLGAMIRLRSECSAKPDAALLALLNLYHFT